MAEQLIDYLKAGKKQKLYVCTRYKNFSDAHKYFKQDKSVSFYPPQLEENASSDARETPQIWLNNLVWI